MSCFQLLNVKENRRLRRYRIFNKVLRYGIKPIHLSFFNKDLRPSVLVILQMQSNIMYIQFHYL